MITVCDKCGGKIKYTKVLKEETVRMPKEDGGCCLFSIFITVITCGLNLVYSYIKSFKKTTKCVVRGTCEKCGKTYEFDSYIGEEDILDEDYDDKKYTYNDICKGCIHAEDELDDNGWCDAIGDYVNGYKNCDKREE